MITVPPDITTQRISPASIGELSESGIKEKKKIRRGEEPGCVVLELGYFIDFRKKIMEDPLSVVLSLTDEEKQDERVMISINEMLEEYVW